MKTVRYICFLLSIALLLVGGCKKSEPVEDLSGEYVMDYVKEILGSDPLGGDAFTMTVQKTGKNYRFTLIHREKEISVIEKPFLDTQFEGYIDVAESKVMISRTDTGLACEILADTGTYHFIIYMKKSEG